MMLTAVTQVPAQELGMSFDFGNHFSLDFATYIPNSWAGTWVTAVNIIYRF